jgi:hypothetical protein
MNVEIRDAFILHRLMKQGYLLAPHIFILTTNVLEYMLQNPKVKVEGLTFPKGKMLRDQTFAHDIAFYLKGTKDNMDKAKKVLDTFCLAFGTHVSTNPVQFGLQRWKGIGIGGKI